ncbi:zf-HC2 domain-containing protein [Paenibacillus paridis]|uniref:zf-HC2 domain-containing protein n=1 Tax=Paenibacillus paridis TaxID=2583376 RepID=UPI001391F925|nr:zf-HC2 domain-containing protein [Paenibacillus paridis]
MKCDIVRDLLPSYIEKLTSNHSNEEIEKHLQTCEECHQFYKEMIETTGLTLPVVDNEEVEKLNYLKKVKKKNTKAIVISIAAVLVLAASILGLFVIGFPVSSKDVNIVYEKNNGILEINLTLKKKSQDLVFSSKSEFIKDKEGNVIGYVSRYTPRGLLHNPLDNVGNEVMVGTHLNNEMESPNTFIIEFKDKTMTFVNGILME